MEKGKIIIGILAVALAVSLVGNAYLWNSTNRQNAEHIAAITSLEKEINQGKEAQETLKSELDQAKTELELTKHDLEQTKNDLNHAENEIAFLKAPVYVVDPETGLLVQAPGNGKPPVSEEELMQDPPEPTFSEEAEKQLEELLNGGGQGNTEGQGNSGNENQGNGGGQPGGKGNQQDQSFWESFDFGNATHGTEGHQDEGGGDTSNVPHYNPFA